MCPKLIALSSESKSLFDDVTLFMPFDMHIKKVLSQVKNREDLLTLSKIWGHFS